MKVTFSKNTTTIIHVYELFSVKEADDPSVAQAQPAAIALSGKGGLSAASPIATSITGDGGIAVSAPQATSIAGDFPEEEEQKKQ